MRRAHFHHTDSTSTQAAALFAHSPGEPLLVTADAQSAGRGRAGRAWHSPVGGAWFTLAWPTATAPTATAPVPLLAGLAVCDEIATLLGPPHRVRIKWPNDVLLDDRKLAGILCEQHVQPGATARALLVGVGINANLWADALGDDLRRPATSLRETLGRDIDLDALITACAERIAGHMRVLESEGLTAANVGRLNDLLAWRGRRVALQRGELHVEGVLKGLDPAGRALVGGRVYEAGEVVSLSPDANGQAP